MLKIKTDYLKVANYALVYNGIDLCKSLEIRWTPDSTTKTEDLQDVMISCQGEFITEFRTPVMATLAPNRSIRIKNFEIKPDADKMAALTEGLHSSFTITVTVHATSDETRRELIREEFPIDLMPYDQWLGTTVLPQSLVSFITPNTPAVSQLIVKAARHLKEISGSSSFTEYQSGNPNEVMRQVAAIYAALHAEGIVYRSLPVSYEQIGQRITLPDQVLATKLANCIELSLLFASVLEGVGINSGIIVESGHAYLGIWLVNDSCRYSTLDDAAFIEKKCSKGIEEIMVIETTGIAAEDTSLEQARLTAEQHLAVTENFRMFIDVRRCRLERFLPLPARILKDGQWEIQSDGVAHDSIDLHLTEHSRYDLTKVINTQQELSRMDIWERKLLDFSLRNNMLNLYLRQRAVQLISLDVDQIEDHLQDGEEYHIVERPDVDFKANDEGGRLIRSRLAEPIRELVSTDISHHQLHTYLSETETKSVLKNIYRTARNSIEETGANSLFMTIGTLRWYETEQSEKPHYAPVLMLPVEMVYKKGGYYIRTRDEEIMLNVTLMEFLRQNYEINIPELRQLPADDHGVDVRLIFTIIREALKEQKRWDVEEECILGVFSFSKYLMWNDVHNHRKELKESPIVESLVERRLTWQTAPLNTSLREKDKALRPEMLALPVAADSSQMAAVLEAGEGHSFILYGPPGTGKSQTITNLIANALFQGKRVLFVAEKMAALSVVQSRLANIGLDPFCLEMHSNKVTKRHVLSQLEKALAVSHIATPNEYQATAEKLYAQRSKLIGYLEALHAVDAADGFSLYDCILQEEAIHAEPLKPFTLNDTLKKALTASTLPDIQQLLDTRLAAVLKLIGQPSQHALLGFHVSQEELRSESDTTARLKEAVNALEKCKNERLQLTEAKTLKEKLLKDNSKALLATDGHQLREEWRAAKAKWFLPRIFAKKSFIKRLRVYNPYITEGEADRVLDSLTDYQELHARIQPIHDVMKKYFRQESGIDELPSDEQILQAVDDLNRWQQHLPMMRDWFHWCAYTDELQQLGLTDVVKALESANHEPREISDRFFKAFFLTKAREKTNASETLRTFEGMLFDEQVEQYKKFTEQFQLLSQKELYARLAAQIPRVTDNLDNSSEIGLLNRNISNGGRGLSLRDLFDQIPKLMPRLCPCMLMSPMSVAQFLDLTQEKFDLVIFDEASQMPTSEAVGAIARGKALVVVGDPKQMPPTSFFTSTNVDEEEADIDDLESILEDCRTLEIPSLQLNWHYRSRHESLIAFSNNEYYDGKLITFPSVDDQETKVQFVPVEGVYDKGGRRSNRAEAEAIVKEVERRLIGDGQTSTDALQPSIGIIAFSVVQQNLIEDILQEKLDNNFALRQAADALYEPIFVKNLENVQGDERDVILFSVGYGPDKHGNVSMNFGPLNNAGGERRLNVAVSRARQEMMVFSTMRSSHIDLRRSKARGVEGLKHFLEYAEQQVLAENIQATEPRRDTSLAREIADAIAAKGYVVHVNVGRSQFKVDVAVSRQESPDTYTLGILLDGESYRDTQTTRDREIVQPSVLEGLRWRVMRVWSVDWLNNPERVLNRIVEQIETAPAAFKETRPVAFDISQEKLLEQPSLSRPYEEFTMPPAEVNKLKERELIRRIVEKEQPLTLNTLCRRICALRTIPRTTPGMQKAVRDFVSQQYEAETDRQGLVIWKSKQDKDEWRWYRQAHGRDILDVPMREIKNAVTEAVTEQFSISAAALTLIVAKKLGYSRRGPKVDAAINEAVAQLQKENKLTETNGSLSPNVE